MSVINTYGFPFTNSSGDRLYGASDWRDYYKNLHNSGVIRDVDNELEVTEAGTPAKTVEINTGSILINGVMINNDQVKTVSFADNNSGNPRIDRVVARLDNTNRYIEFAVIQGTPAASPVAPTLTQTTTTFELSLAQVYLVNGYTTILNANITDERSDVSVCGYATVNTGLKTTQNRFFRGFDLSVSASTVTEWNWSSVTDGSNDKIYISSNRIRLDSSVKMAWLYLNLYTSATDVNVYVEYPPSATYTFAMRGGYGYSTSGNLNICVPLIGTGAINDILINVFGGSGFTVYSDNFWSFAEVVALYN